MTLVSDSTWAAYRNILKAFHDDFNQETLTWRRYTKVIGQFTEDNTSTSEDLPLKVLVGYNFFRKWPVIRKKDVGELHDQNLIVLINLDYLQEEGYLDVNGNFIYERSQDLFLINGVLYRSEGDTNVSQAGTKPTHIQIILREEERATDENA